MMASRAGVTGAAEPLAPTAPAPNTSTPLAHSSSDSATLLLPTLPLSVRSTAGCPPIGAAALALRAKVPVWPLEVSLNDPHRAARDCTPERKEVAPDAF